MKGQKLKDNVVKIKNYVVEMPKKKKIQWGAIIGGVILLAVIVAVALNLGRGDGYQVLYSDTTTEEASEVYDALVELGASPRMNEQGEVMVPAEEYDTWLLRLAAEGYPHTAMPYDIFSSHSGMTTTESEKEQWLVFQLQDRIQATLKRLNGVNNATVTITVPETSDYVWQQAENTAQPTASVLLSFSRGSTLTGEQVTAIKNLIAAAVPQMEPENVTVVDAGSNLELFGEEENSSRFSSSENLELEQMVQRQIEENITRLLTPRYGADGVVAVAKVTLNYDAMLTERQELIERPDEGGGYLTHNEQDYTTTGDAAAGGIVGEEDNTDIPEQNYVDPNEIEGLQEYHNLSDYEYGYIKTQIEKGNAVLERATVSVMVNEENLTDTRREELVNLVSKSADIDPENIYVSPYSPPTEEVIPTQGGWDWTMIPIWLYIVLGGLLLLLILLIIILVHIRKKQKKQVLAEEMELEEKRKSIEDEINRYKQQLSDAALAATDPKSDAIVDEVRSFAKENPEITANLLRSWLKEDESN